MSVLHRLYGIYLLFIYLFHWSQIRKIGEVLKKITEAVKVAESEFGDSKLVLEMKRALKLLSSCQEKLNSLHIELKDLNIKIYEEKKKKDTCGDSSS